MKIKVNDTVIVISGKDRGKTGKITKIIKKHDRIVVEKLNMRTKHIKKTSQRAGEKIRFEAPMHASNVMILDPKTKKPTRIGYKRLESGKKERISKKSGASLDVITAEVKTKPKKEAKTKKTVIKA